MPNREQLTAAVNYLILAPNYSKLVRRVMAVVERWPTEPMAFAGDLAVLNPLIDVGVKKREALERLVALADERRLGSKQTRSKAHRQAYQKRLMATRRARIAKAIQLHEQRVGHLSWAGRKTFEAQQRREWERQRAARLSTVTYAERSRVISDFWAEVDADLDARLAPSTGAHFEAAASLH